MSNKKRRNRKIVSDSSEAADQAINKLSQKVGMTDSNIQSVQSDSSAGTGLLSYLKSHLWVVGVISFLTLGVLGAGLKYLDESAAGNCQTRWFQEESQ